MKDMNMTWIMRLRWSSSLVTSYLWKILVTEPVEKSPVILLASARASARAFIGGPREEILGYNVTVDYGSTSRTVVFKLGGCRHLTGTNTIFEGLAL